MLISTITVMCMQREKDFCSLHLLSVIYFSLLQSDLPVVAALSAVKVLHPLRAVGSMALKGMSQSGARQSTSSS